MSVVCLDGVISEDDLRAWRAGQLSASVQLTYAQVRAVFCGPCLARGVALRGLTATQILKLFPARSRRKNAYKLRTWAGRISGRRARRVLAAASWHQIRAAAQHQEEEAQIRAAIAYSVAKGSPHEQHPVPPRMSLVTIRESSINAVSR